MKKCLWDDCEVETDNPKFCSLSCGTKYQMKYNNKIKKSYPDKQCLQCGSDFSVDSNTKTKKFCNRKCSALHNNLVRGEKQNRPCETCGEITRRKFCSRECSSRAKVKRNITSWLAGEWDGSVKHGLSNSIKKYLIKGAGNRCTMPDCAVPGGFCSVNPVTGRVPLEVDHIDGNCYNNTRENLRVVCPNCHALTPTYRALNKNSSRAYRRKNTEKS